MTKDLFKKGIVELLEMFNEIEFLDENEKAQKFQEIFDDMLSNFYTTNCSDFIAAQTQIASKINKKFGYDINWDIFNISLRDGFIEDFDVNTKLNDIPSGSLLLNQDGEIIQIDKKGNYIACKVLNAKNKIYIFETKFNYTLLIFKNLVKVRINNDKTLRNVE